MKLMRYDSESSRNKEGVEKEHNLLSKYNFNFHTLAVMSEYTSK